VASGFGCLAGRKLGHSSDESIDEVSMADVVRALGWSGADGRPAKE
jgi:hypothetical protein